MTGFYNPNTDSPSDALRKSRDVLSFVKESIAAVPAENDYSLSRSATDGLCWILDLLDATLGAVMKAV